MPVAEAFNLIRAVADPWPNAFLRGGNKDLHVSWALPSALPCAQGSFRATREGTLLGFADGALLIHVLRRQGVQSNRSSEHAAWIGELGIPEGKV